MTGSSSSSDRAKARRCPKCRRRMGRVALTCYHCNWHVPYREVYRLFISLGIGLVGVAIALTVMRFIGDGKSNTNPVNLSKPQKK